jgi:hypothetical protein
MDAEKIIVLYQHYFFKPHLVINALKTHKPAAIKRLIYPPTSAKENSPFHRRFIFLKWKNASSKKKLSNTAKVA